MESSGYKFLMRLFHRMALGSKVVAEISFDIEKSFFLKQSAHIVSEEKHLFVSGLARSGTTALLNCLYKTNEFASLNYADMPFILAPNLGRKLFTGTSKTNFKERAHKDGIFINSESPEALDEVYWKVFLNDNYIQKDRLLINNPSSVVLNQFKDYIHLILKKNQNGKQLRYLSKNNNNILRLHSIIATFPNSQIIIPFRDPLQQALSLLNQHNHFCKIHKEDPFSLKYMNWIGHHEFGLNQKPFFLNDKAIFDQMEQSNKEEINYWLLSWLNYYSYIVNNLSKNYILFSFERFCREPNIVLGELLKKIDLENYNLNLFPFEIKTRSCDNIDKKILSDCQIVYDKLVQLTI